MNRLHLKFVEQQSPRPEEIQQLIDEFERYLQEFLHGITKETTRSHYRVGASV